MSGRSTGRRGRQPAPSRFPRIARINELLREVLAESIERLADGDPRLEMVTVTAVRCDADLRRATVLLSSLGPDVAAGLADARVRLQAVVAREIRMKHTPLLAFEADAAVAQGQRIDELLRVIPPPTVSDDESWRANYRDDSDVAVPIDDGPDDGSRADEDGGGG
jgi:ribosome-binding factor A